MPRFQDVTIAGTLSLSAESQILPKLSTPEVNSIRFVTNDTTPGFGTIQEAVDDLGSNSGLVIVRSTYTGADPTSVGENVTILDLRKEGAVTGSKSQANMFIHSGVADPQLIIGGLFPSFPRKALVSVIYEVADTGAGAGTNEGGQEAVQASIDMKDPDIDFTAFYGQAIASVASDEGGAWGANFQAIGGGNLDTKLSGMELDISSQLFLPVNISTISRTSNVVTVDTAVAHGLSVSDTIYVGGTTGTTDFKGTFQVASVPDTDTLTYNQTAANDTGSGGDVRKMSLGSKSKSGLLINALNNELSDAILIGSGDLHRGIFRNGLVFVAKSMNPFSGALLGAQAAPYNNGIDWGLVTFNGAAIRIPNNSLFRFRNAADSADITAVNVNAFDQVELGDGSAQIKIQKGIISDGGGLKHARITTGSISASSSALVTVTWGTAFTDSNYTAVFSVFEGTASRTLQADKIESQTASAMTVRVFNNDSGSARTGTLEVIAIHD